MVYYLKYRPQSLDELIGQEQVKKTLLKAFESDKLSHAYLFCGPKGTGKTSTARILAKMVNCQLSVHQFPPEANQPLAGTGKQKTDNRIPCNVCSSCISITDGSNLDLIEIDAASNRGIDDIRDLREKIKLSPSSSKKKIYIIDEVHMLSTEAFNALLKTLEEPPSHVIFILATTEVHKIPQTILSRVLKLEFKQASHQELVQALERVVKAEKIEIDEDALKLLSLKSDGSFRDGLKLLDQLASQNQKINSALVEELLRSSSFESIIKILNNLASKDSKSALDQILDALERGINIKEYLLSIIEYLRFALLIQYQLGQNVKEEIGSDKFSLLNEIAKGFTNDSLILTLKSFEQALEGMKTSSFPSLPLEIAVIESCGASENLMRSEDQKLKNSSDNQSINKLKNQNSDISESPSDLLKLKDKWMYILETVKPYNFSLEAMLKLAEIEDLSEDIVTLKVPYSFHQRILEAPKSKSLLESVLSEVLGRPIKVATVLGKKPKGVEDIANVDIAADDEVIKIAAEIFNSDAVN